jgi:hypothetical protein
MVLSNGEIIDRPRFLGASEDKTFAEKSVSQEERFEEQRKGEEVLSLHHL